MKGVAVKLMFSLAMAQAARMLNCFDQMSIARNSQSESQFRFSFDTDYSRQ